MNNYKGLAQQLVELAKQIPQSHTDEQDAFAQAVAEIIEDMPVYHGRHAELSLSGLQVAVNHVIGHLHKDDPLRNGELDEDSEEYKLLNYLRMKETLAVQGERLEDIVSLDEYMGREANP